MIARLQSFGTRSIQSEPMNENLSPLWPKRRVPPVRRGNALIAVCGAVVSVSFTSAATAQDAPRAENTARPAGRAAAAPIAPTLELKAHAGAVHAVTFSTDGTLVATAGSDGIVKIWRLPSGTAVGEFGAWASVVNRPVFSADGGTLVYLGASGRVVIHPMKAGGVDRVIEWPVDGELSGMDMPPDGRVIAAASGTQLALWDAATGAEIAVRTPHGEASIRALACSMDGARIATVGDNARLLITEIRTGKVLFEAAQEAPGVRVAWSPAGSPVLVQRTARDVHAIEIKTGSTYHLLDLPEDRSPLDFSPLGTSLAAGWNDGTVHTWTRTRGAWMVGPYAGGAAPITALRHSWNGALLAGADAEGMLRVWPVQAEGTP